MAIVVKKYMYTAIIAIRELCFSIYGIGYIYPSFLGICI